MVLQVAEFTERKMTIYKEIIINLDTGIETKKEFSAKELKEFDAAQLISSQKREIEAKKLQEKAEARSAAEAKLLELGLTTQDLKALLG
jgi:UDP-galactopyranose mutase